MLAYRRLTYGVRAGLGMLLLLWCASCIGSAPTDTTPEPPSNPLIFKAMLDGTPWQPTTITFSANQYGGFDVMALDLFGPARFFVTMSVGHVIGVGTYPLTGELGPFEGGRASVSSGSAFWFTNLTGGSGTLTISSATTTRIGGTFQFTAPPSAGFGGTRQVTQGEFDLPIAGTGFEVTPLNAAFRVTVVADSVACVPRFMSVNGIPGDRLILSVSCLDGQSLSIDLSGFTGVGSYALGGGGTRTMSFSRSASGLYQSFGGSNASSSGTVDVTTYVAGTSAGTTRIAGTFSATLPPMTANSGTIAVQVSGSFDVRK